MRRLTSSELDDLKARNPVDAVAGDWVKLRRRRGRSARGFTHVGPCPLCSSGQAKGDARFECNADKWACAACGKGGDVVTLWALCHGLDLSRDFIAIVERLGGVRAVKETPATAQRAGRHAHDRAFSGKTAVNGLLPCPPVGVAYASDPVLARAWQDGWEKAAHQAWRQAEYREAERKRLHDIWDHAADWRGSPVETYLDRRGLQVPGFSHGANAASGTRAAKLRYMAEAPFFHGETIDDIGRRSPRVIYRGPAMLAAIRDAVGMFRGLHFTWLDPSLCDPSRTTLDDGSLDAAAKRRWKAEIVDPDSGEVLKAKKSRGSKQGGYIDLGGVPLPLEMTPTPDPSPPSGRLRPSSTGYGGGERATFDRQFSGEGIESTLAVYTAMVLARRDVRGIAWRAGIDLGNLVGSAEDSARHPDLKDKAGRARNVPGRTPDLASPAMPVVAGARELVQLADGDSDAFTTACAMARGEARRAAEGLAARTLWPPPGLDFNDWLVSGKATIKQGAAS